jgi:hypothetical protein
MESLLTGYTLHAATALMTVLLIFAGWAALAVSRRAVPLPSPSKEGGRPLSAKTRPNGAGRVIPNGDRSYVPPQPVAATTPNIPAQPSAATDLQPEVGLRPDRVPSATELPDPVEFSIYAPLKAPSGVPFDIRIVISMYDEFEKEEIKAAGYKTFETLVVDFRRGDLIRVQVEGGLEIDAPEQSLRWGQRETTLVFVGRLPNRARLGQVFTTTLHVFLDDIALGQINFEVACDSKVMSSKDSRRHSWSEVQIRDHAMRTQLRGQGFGALRYRRVFVSHVKADIEPITYLFDALHYAGIEAVVAVRDFYIGTPHWEYLVQENFNHTCDAMLLCWSENAAKDYYENPTSAIKSEMEMAVKFESDRKRRFKLLPYMLGGKKVPLPKGYEGRPFNSKGLTEREAARPRAQRA